MLRSVILLTTVLGHWRLQVGVRGVFAQLQPQCHVPGICLDVDVLHLTNVPDYNACLAECRDFAGATWFTFDPLNDDCLLLDGCPNLSVSQCPECFSGEVDCEDYSELQCDLDGACLGNIQGFQDEVESLSACQELCANEPECLWYTYDTAARVCILLRDCGDGPDSTECQSCTSGESGCGDDDSGPPPDGNGTFDKILVLGGSDITNGDPEFLDLSNPLSVCNQPAYYPLDRPVEKPVSAFIDGFPMVCGGFSDGETAACFIYHAGDDSWVSGPDLPEPRFGAMSVLLDENTWWIAGGQNDNGQLPLTTWVLRAGEAEFQEYVSLPRAMNSFCMTKLDQDTVLFHDAIVSHVTLLFNITSGLFQTIDDPQTPRYRAFCGAVERSDSVKEVVLAGGINSNSQCTSTTEIFSLDLMRWRPGPSLPTALCSGTAVNNRNNTGFYLVGGFDGSNEVSTVYEFDADAEAWTELGQQLGTARQDHTALLVTDSSATCFSG